MIDAVTGDITTYTHDPANRLLWSANSQGITTYTYDANGNQLTLELPNGDITTQTWDFENRLVQIEHPSGDIVACVYDPDGHRVQQDDGLDTLAYVYDGNTLLQERDGSGTLVADYTTEPADYGRPLSQHRDGASHFFHVSGIRDVTVLSDSTGFVSDEARFDAWGGQLSSTGFTETPYGYKGEAGYYREPQLDPEAATGHESSFYLHNRLLDSATGRFRSADPADDDLNTYRYVRNNPVNAEDPSGLQEKSVAQRMWDYWIEVRIRCQEPFSNSVLSSTDKVSGTVF